jgi:Ca2+-binding EF-hand superfamily protein
MGNIPSAKLPEEEHKVLCELWDDLSQRCGGFIDRDIFLRLYNVPGLLGERLFEAFDVNHTGKISRTEFLNGTAFYIAGKTEDKIRVLWQLHDLHNDGGVTPEDLTVILSTLSTTDVLNGNSNEPVDAVHRQRRVNQIVCETFTKCNLCKDGLLHLDEFKLFLKQHPDIIGALENVVCWRDWNPEKVQEHDLAMEREHHTFKDLKLVRSISQSPTEQNVTFQGELYKFAGLLDSPPHSSKIKKRWAFLHHGFLYIFYKQREHTPAHIIFLDGCSITEYTQKRKGVLNKNKPAHVGFQIHANGHLMHTWFVPDHKLVQSWITSLRWAAHTLEFHAYYRLEEELGRGISSIVYKGCHLVTGKYFAIKIIEKKDLRPDGHEGVRSEIAILKLIDDEEHQLLLL